MGLVLMDGWMDGMMDLWVGVEQFMDLMDEEVDEWIAG